MHHKKKNVNRKESNRLNNNNNKKKGLHLIYLSPRKNNDADIILK